MCRFILFKGEDSVLLADLLTRPAHSIINQSFDSRLRVDLHRPLNGDGFGVGWYDSYKDYSAASICSKSSKEKRESTQPCIFTSVLPAWNNPNLNRLSEKIHSRLVFCHVRAASPGFPISETNCHPFQYGNIMFMHNGYIADFKKIKRRLERLLPDPIYNCMNGNTDSEFCFSVFLSLLAEPLKKAFSLNELTEALFKTIEILNDFSREAGIKYVKQT